MQQKKESRHVGVADLEYVRVWKGTQKLYSSIPFVDGKTEVHRRK